VGQGRTENTREASAARASVDGRAKEAGEKPEPPPPPKRKQPESRPTDARQIPKRKSKGHARKYDRPAIKRQSYGTLQSKLPGRPFLALLDTGDPPQCYPLRHTLASIGRGPDNQITLRRDDRMSRTHTLFALIGRDFIAIDLGSRHGTFVNGRRVTQAHLRLGDVIDVGRTRIVFAVVPGADMLWGYELCPLLSGGRGASEKDATEEPISGEIVATAADDDDEQDAIAQVVLHDLPSGKRVTSDGRPILIGGHEVCHLTPAGEGVATFHAQVYWGEHGIHVRDLGSESGTFVNNAPIDDVPLKTGDVVSVGNAKMEVGCHGDVEQRCRALAAEHDADRPWALTCVSGEVQGVSATLPVSDEPLTLGRGPKCDLCAKDSRISSKHVSLAVGEDAIKVKDLGSRNAIFVHGKKVRSATLGPGDPFSVGKPEFLVHYAI